MNTQNRADVQAVAESRQPFMLVPIVSRSAPGPDVWPAPGLDVISAHATAEAAATARSEHATPARGTVIDARACLKGRHWFWSKPATDSG